MRSWPAGNDGLDEAWEADLLYEEVTGTLLCGDLFTTLGDGPAVTKGDNLDAVITAEEAFGYSSITANTAPIIRRLAELAPTTLACMHGSSHNGDCTIALEGLADYYAAHLAAAADAT